jgi:hypothetical protein
MGGLKNFKLRQVLKLENTLFDMIQNNSGVLPFYAQRSHKLKNRDYTHGKGFSWPVPVNYSPPINLIRRGENKGRPILSVKVISLDSNVETNVTAEMTLAGLQIITPAGVDYDIVWFPSSLPIPVTLSTGSYEMIIDDGVIEWISEDFCMLDNLDDYVKIRFCHPTHLDVDNGSLYYSGTSENAIYIKTQIKKPSYQFIETDIEERDGYEFAGKIVSFKQHKFGILGTESLFDVFRLLPLHYTVIIEWNGETYNVNKIEMSDPEWYRYGRVGTAEATFRTDTVVTVVNKGVSSPGACKPTPENCVEVDHEVIGLIIEGSDEYNNGYKEDENGNRFYLSDGSKVLVATEPLGLIYPFEFSPVSGGTYTLIPNSESDIAYATREDLYYQRLPAQGFLPSGVTSYTPDESGTWIAQGNVVADLIIEVVLYFENGSQLLAGVGTSSDFTTTGISFNYSPGAIAVGIKGGNVACGYFLKSNWYYFQGFGFEQFGGMLFRDEQTGERPAGQIEITDVIEL